MPALIPLLAVVGLVALLATQTRTGVPRDWTPAEQQRVDDAIAQCLADLQSQGWPEAAVSDPSDPEAPPLPPVEGLQLCLAQTLYPRESWPPTAGETGNKAIAWGKLGEAAALAMSEAGL